jgi:tetraacyldisaccharide 4'-kinase
VFLTVASSIYGMAATWRRRWYAGDPSRRRRLSQPVISVGNLSTGGSGKTPVVREIARLLLEAGERPAILSRGYGRRAAPDGVTVVSDGVRIVASVDEAGDEPFMLARMCTRVPVLVGRDRYLSGRLAEQRFGTTVHVLDDGFQHFGLARDVDLLLARAGDLTDRVLPAGMLREPLAAAANADALLTTDAARDELDRLRSHLGVDMAFQVHRTLGEPRWIATGEPALVSKDRPAVAFAGIARPERFFADLAAAGWALAETIVFRDHHWFTGADVARIAAAANRSQSAAVLTTEKDAVRLSGRRLDELHAAAVPLEVRIGPPEFVTWLLSRIGKRASAASSRGSINRGPVGLRASES